MKRLFLIVLLLFSLNVCATPGIQPGAAQLSLYLPLLKDKRVGLFANHTSLINGQHLIDVLLENKIQVVKIFAPEHGFRGEDDHRITNSIDEKTGIPIVSLYGKKLKPTPEDLSDVDILVFDIQDVGVRFYTYISSLQKFMEGALANNKTLILLDRPNPNGFYVDGPILEPQYKSFTGMQPIPVVYGMTMGEYAKMLIGEEWLHVSPASKAKELDLIVIPCRNYTHRSHYVPPVKPSPNLPDIQSIYWYPTIGMMEATAMSVGRGTPKPFQVFGHPTLPTQFTFVPELIVGGTKPRYYQETCYGFDLRSNPAAALKKIDNKLQIKYIMEAYRLFPNKPRFFQGFSSAAGTDKLETQIKSGLSEREIRDSWAPSLGAFKAIRHKYLLYSDFE